MIVDVSEIKEFRGCKRKWQFSSRNQFHLRPKVQNKNFLMGTVFHNCLHKLYVGVPIEEVSTYLIDCTKELDPKDVMVLRSMVEGYEREVMPLDREAYTILDIEHRFKFSPAAYLQHAAQNEETLHNSWIADQLAELEVTGAIDMIALRKEDGTIWGFEHKTARNFRTEVYALMDEQPRVYTAALQMWVDTYNAEHSTQYTLGGVYINEVKKLVKAFDYKRTPMVYSNEDIRAFMFGFFLSCEDLQEYHESPTWPRVPQPDFLKCGNCAYAQVCIDMQYESMSLDALLAKYGDTLAVREVDHLEEKDEVTL